MTSITNDRKSRGRPKVGATHIGVRVPPDLLAAVDAWIVANDPTLTRPAAIRAILTKALG